MGGKYNPLDLPNVIQPKVQFSNNNSMAIVQTNNPGLATTALPSGININENTDQQNRTIDASYRSFFLPGASRGMQAAMNMSIGQKLSPGGRYRLLQGKPDLTKRNRSHYQTFNKQTSPVGWTKNLTSKLARRNAPHMQAKMNINVARLTEEQLNDALPDIHNQRRQ